MILLHLDQYLHSGNQNTFSGPDHNAQKLMSIFDLNVIRHVTVQCYGVLIPLRGKFLSRRTKEHPENLVYNVVN